MKAKEFLNDAFLLDELINAKMEQLMRLRSLACSFTSVLQENKVMSGGYTKSSLEESVVKIIIAEKELNEQIDRLIDYKDEILNIIELIDNKEEQLLLQLRYLCFNKWDQIATKMHYGIASIYRLHNQALASFDIQLADRSGNYHE